MNRIGTMKYQNDNIYEGEFNDGMMKVSSCLNGLKKEFMLETIKTIRNMDWDFHLEF